MGALGSLVSNAVDAAKGTSSGTNLQSFLQKFQSQSGRYVDTLDPLATFDVRIKFYPTLTAEELSKRQDPSMLGRIGGSLKNSLMSMGTSALDNLTGGLFSSLTEGGKGSVLKQKKAFKDAGKHSFVEYAAPANLLQGGEQWQNSEQASCPLELNIGPYVQKIPGINLEMANTAQSQSQFGDFTINGNLVKPSGSLQMEILNTKAALHERIFYPWMRECTLPYWSYESQPCTTATITVDFTKHNTVKYVFCGCRPNQIKLLDADQSADSSNLVRNVNFIYDFMFITSDLAVNDSWQDKLMGSAGSLLGGASKLLNI